MLLKSVLISSGHNARIIAFVFLCVFLFSNKVSYAVLTPGTIGNNQTICAGSSPNAFNSISPATNGTGTLNYQWQISTAGPNTGYSDINGATALTFNASVLNQTTYFRRAVSTINDPVVFSNVITVTVSDSSVGGIIYRSRNSCRGTDLTIFTLVGNVGNVIRWESSPSNLNPVWTAIANTTNELTLSSFATTIYYRAVVQNGSCPEAFSSINFTIANPSLSNGWVITPPPGIACGGTNSFVFTFVAFTGTVLRWESSPSPGFNSPTVIPNTANTTQYIATNLNTTMYYRAVTSTGNCSEINSVAEGKEILPPSVGGSILGSDTICSNTNSTNLNLSGHIGTILRWESSSDINFNSINTISNNSTLYTAVNINTTTYFRAVVKRGTCPEVYSSIATITINTSDTSSGLISGAGTYCTSAASIPLSLIGNSGSVISWQSADDSSFTTNLSNISVTNNVLNVGRPFPFIRYYRALVNIPGCGTKFSGFVKIIIVDQTIAGTINGSITFCSKINSHSINLTGNIGTVLRWESSVNSNFIPSNIIPNTSTSLNLTNLDTTTYYRAVVRNDSCDVKFSNVSIVTILEPPTAGIVNGSDTICNTNNINSTQLFLSNYSGIISKWQSSSNANFSSNVIDISNTNDSLLVSNISTTTFYRVIVSNNPCSADTSTIATILVNPSSNGGTVTGNSPFNPNIVVCTGINTSTLLLNGHVGTILKWQSSPNADFTSPVTDIANTTTTNIATNLSSTTYYRVIVKSGICEEDTSSIKVITVNPISDGGILNNDTVCINTNSTVLHLTNYVGNIIKWESSTFSNFSGNVTSIVNTTDSLVVTNLPTQTFYRVIVKSGVCSADTSTIGNISLTDESVGGTIDGPLGFCRSINSSTLTLSGHVGAVIEWQSSTTSDFSGPVTSIPNSSNQLSINVTNLSTTTYYRALIQNGNCSSIFSSVKVLSELGPFPDAGIIDGPSSVCIGSNSATLTLTAYVGTIRKWQSSTVADFSSNVTDIANTTNMLSMLNLSSLMYYRVIVFSGPLACEDTTLAKEISIDSKPIAGIIIGSDTICASQTVNSTLLSLTGFSGTIIKWQSSTDSTFSTNVVDITNSTSTYVVTNLTTTTYYRVLVRNGVCDTAISVKSAITVNPISVGGILTNDTVCSGINTSMLRLTNFLGSILKWESSTLADFSSSITSIANSSDSLLVLNLTTSTYFRVIVKSGVCAADTSVIGNVHVLSTFISNTIFAPSIDSFINAGNPDTLKGTIANIDTSLINYIWQSSSLSDSKGFSNIAGAIHQHYNPDTITQTTWCRRIVIHWYCEIRDTSNIIQLVILAPTDTPNARIGVSKSVTNPIIISPGVYHVDYLITLKNYGESDLNNIRIVENLKSTFPSPSEFSILNLLADEGLKINPNFDGNTDIELLDSLQSSLLISELLTVRIKLQITTNLPNASFTNQVYAYGHAANTSISVVDTSVDGDNPDPNSDGIPDEESPTVFSIAVFVPSGFSPNGDNKNDEFKIVGLENYPNNKLEIYNRWGNLVFEQAPYDNKWKGAVKNTDAIVFGDGILPSGTYFYLLDFGIPGVKQLTGYIVIRK